MTSPIHLFDTVSLLTDNREHGLVRGQSTVHISLPWATALLSVLLAACAGEDDASNAEGPSATDHAVEQETPSPQQRTEGGLTGDFAGVPAACTASRLESVDDEPALGFSVSNILEATTGSFRFDAIWGAQCHFPPPDRLVNCGSEENTPYLLDQVESRLVVELAASGEPATILYQPDGELACAQNMRIPVRVSLRSEDGLLDEPAVELDLESSCGNVASVYHVARLDSLRGTLWSEAVGMSAEWEVTWYLHFARDAVWFALSIVPPGASTVVDLGDPANDAAVRASTRVALPAADATNRFCVDG